MNGKISPMLAASVCRRVPRFAVIIWIVCALGRAASCNASPHETANWVGANYTPAYAVNQVQCWHDFRPDVVERELAAAKRHFGITTLRVYLHNINFDEERDEFLANIEQFLQICERHGIRPGFTFFDDCHRHDGIFLDDPTEPVKGYHNGRWAACPQDRERKDENLPKFKAYIQDVIRPHRNDSRVLWWEIFRTTKPGRGNDQMRGYYVGFDTKTLHLGKIENNWQPLATFDLDQLDCKVVPGVWNQIRIAAQGARIRVWFDGMHPSADEDHGLRIDFTDPAPILSGAIGMRTHRVPAWYDNVIVLSIDEQP